MKKTILIILAILPIVLLVLIAIAGMIHNAQTTTHVTGVVFKDRWGQIYSEEIVIEQGEERRIMIYIDPVDATYKDLEYFKSEDESICSIVGIEVDEKGITWGIIKGESIGDTTIKVKTRDRNKTAEIDVRVKMDIPYAVKLSKNELEMKIGEKHNLTCEVFAHVAENKNVKYSSDNPSIVTVDANGTLVARAAGTATITVTTELGARTDTCVVTVVEGTLPVYLDFESHPDIQKNDDDVYVCSVNTIDLKSILKTEEGIDPESVIIKIVGGATDNVGTVATLDNGVLNLYRGGIVAVMVYVGDENSPDASMTYNLALQNAN